MGAGVVLVVAVEELVKEPTALVLSTAALSFLAQPARTAAKQQLAMRVVRFSVNMEPPVQMTDGFVRRVPKDERMVGEGLQQDEVGWPRPWRYSWGYRP